MFVSNLVSPETSHSVTFTGGSELLFSKGENVVIKWQPEQLVSNELENKLDINIGTFLQYVPNVKPADLRNTYHFDRNSGQENITLPTVIFQCDIIDGVSSSICPIFFQVSIGSQSQILGKEISGISIWSGVSFLGDLKDNSKINSQCDKWTSTAENSGDVNLLNRLPPCPPTTLFAVWDVNYQRENMVSSVTSDSTYHQSFMNFFHPNITTCYRQSM